MARLNVSRILQKFQAASLRFEDVDLLLFLEGFAELNKFLYLMGTAFKYASIDIQRKVDDLSIPFTRNETYYNYQTLSSMIEHELRFDIVTCGLNCYEMGCQNLLKISRGLEFIQSILQNLNQPEGKKSAAKVYRQAYNRTLAKYHPFLLRSHMNVAIFFLPSRHQILKKVCGNEQNVREFLEALPSIISATEIVSSKIRNMYNKYNLNVLLEEQPAPATDRPQ